MSVILRGWCRYQRFTDEHDTLEDAIAAAYWGVHDEAFAPDDIATPDGDIVMDSKALDKAMDSYRA